MERPVVENKVAKKLKRFPKGSILFVDNFLDFGNAESIKKALLRLKKKHCLFARLMASIYIQKQTRIWVYYPFNRRNSYSIAKRDKTRIIPTGVQALNKLGLSTQIPLKVVFLTDGAPEVSG